MLGIIRFAPAAQFTMPRLSIVLVAPPHGWSIPGAYVDMTELPSGYLQSWKAERGYFTLNPFAYLPDDVCDWYENQKMEWEAEMAAWTPYRLRQLFNLNPPKVSLFTGMKRLDKEEVYSRVDMMTLVTRYFSSFRRVGGNVMVKCFMHDDSKPSMSVSVDKKKFYCFVCSSGGSAVDLVMKMENLDFMSALRLLDTM
jgi:hypothetical protein